MPNLKDSKTKKLVKSDFNLYVSSIKRKKENSVDFHVEMVKKIDELLEKHESEKENKESESAPQQGIVKSLKDLVEVREPFERKPEMPHHKEKEIRSNEILNTTNIENELFDIEHPDRTHSDFRFVTSLEEPKDIVRVKNPESEHVEDGDFHSWMLSDQDKSTSNVATSFAKIKVRKGQKPEKINGYTKTKIELEKTKEEIERKKQEIEEIEKEEQEKEKELKKKKIEKIKKEKGQERRKKLEMKKAQEEAKIREQELKKKELEMQKKKKEEGELKALEVKKAEREAEIKERELEKKKKERSKKNQKGKKLKTLELKKEEKEAIKKSKLKEKEEKLEVKKAIREEKLKRKLLEEKKSKKKKVEKSKKEPITVLKKKEKAEKESVEKHHAIFGKKEEQKKETSFDKELQEVLAITDKLLESLPDEVIDKFVQSKDFELYEKVLSKYKIK